MPAPRQQQQSEKLPTIVPQRVNNFISVDKYYRSANLLVRQVGRLSPACYRPLQLIKAVYQQELLTALHLTGLTTWQANEYRARQNELQLYTMLMRLARYD